MALAFPATMPDATPEDDIRGIGAALYALLVNRWPLRGVRACAAGWRRPTSTPRASRSNPGPSIATFRSRSRPRRRARCRRTAASAAPPTLLNLLQQATAVADRTDLIDPVDEPDAPPKRPGSVGGQPDDPEASGRRRKGLIVGISVGAAVIVVALLVLATVLRRHLR